MQTILATGAIGLVGSRFLDLYHDRYQVANMDILSGVDITNKESVVQFIDANPAEVLLHLAAFTDTGAASAQSGDKNGLCYKVNVIGTQNLAEVCKERGIHLIAVSTDFIFDGQKETPYTEDDTPSPIEWYGETKDIAEKVVIESGVSYTIIRLSYPYRANFAGKPDIVKKVRAGLESGKLYPQFSDSLITPTFIDDIAAGFAKVIDTKPKGIFHFVGSSSHSPYVMAQMIAKVYGFDPAVVKEGSLTEYLKSASRPFARHVQMSNAKAKRELELTFADFTTGLAEIKKQQEL